MKKNPLIHSLALMAILFAPLFLQAQQLRWQWAVQAHSMGNSRVCGTACDTAGNIYLAGSFSDTIRFGQQTLAPVGDDDLYWVKFDPEGNVLWAHQAGGSGRDMPTAMTVSEAGMIYTAGICGKEAFPQQEKTGMRRINFFLNCHTPAGELQWIKTFGAKRSDQITAIAIDTAGRIYFGGYFEQRLSIGGHQLMAAGSRDAFIVCMDTSGQTTWAKSFGGVGAERITALRVDATSSRVRLLGDSDLSFSLAHTTVTPAAAGDVAVFTALCYADGTIEAVNSRISGPAVDACCIMETSDSLLLVGGNFSDSLAVGTSALYTYGGGDMFIAAIDITGALVWHHIT